MWWSLKDLLIKFIFAFGELINFLIVNVSQELHVRKLDLKTFAIEEIRELFCGIYIPEWSLNGRTRATKFHLFWLCIINLVSCLWNAASRSCKLYPMRLLLLLCNVQKICRICFRSSHRVGKITSRNLAIKWWKWITQNINPQEFNTPKSLK